MRRWWPPLTGLLTLPLRNVANANQGGLFDMMGDDAHGSSTEEPDLVAIAPWGVKERLTYEKPALGFYLLATCSTRWSAR